MRRVGFSLIELLVVVAIMAILVGLLLSAVQKVRAAATRTKCQNNVKQLALAAHIYAGANSGRFPFGTSPSPSNASFLVHLLPYVEQAAVYAKFSTAFDVNTAAELSAVRMTQTPTYLCPADGGRGAALGPVVGDPADPAGRTSYHGSIGAHAWVRDWSPGFAFGKPSGRTGLFAHEWAVRISEVDDGTSNTALVSEVKRGASPEASATDPYRVAVAVWNGGPTSQETPGETAAGTRPRWNNNNFSPPVTACDAVPPPGFGEVGLRYYGNAFLSVFYTHTVPPNNAGRDCYSAGGLEIHLAARSYHPGGVMVGFGDGSVRFVTDGIGPDVWKAVGTRAGGEPVNLD
jgi:prepilin-type N-terminal cleavage/methylation domain-containing protein/prepilin-type processing-associated H-X9-DG protein